MMRKIIEAVEDKWETLPKEKFSDKQRKFFFAVGAMRDSKEGDGKVEVNYSKIPKRKESSKSVSEYFATTLSKIYDIEKHKDGSWAVLRNGELLYTEDSEEDARKEAERLEDEYEKGYDVTFTLFNKSGKDGDGKSDKKENVKAFSEKEAIDNIRYMYGKGYLVRNINAKKVK